MDQSFNGRESTVDIGSIIAGIANADEDNSAKVPVKKLADLFDTCVSKIDDSSMKVYLRVRPTSKLESTILVESEHTIVTNAPESSKRALYTKTESRHYAFSRVFDGYSEQKDVFDHTAGPLLNRFLKENENIVVLAYGMTNAGKTFTIQGTNQLPGLLPRLVTKILDYMKQTENASTTAFELNISMLEIYQENIYDLLTNKRREKLSIRDANGRIEVNKLSNHPITNPQDAMKLMDVAANKRSKSSTLLNQGSSRSHAVYTLTLSHTTGGAAGGGGTTVSRAFQLVDLAGAERSNRTKATSTQQKEANIINTSLMQLWRCLQAVKKRNHDLNATTGSNGSGNNSNPEVMIPFRESKLTHLLMPILSRAGLAGVAMIACVNPSNDDYDETLTILGNASLASKIREFHDVGRTAAQQVPAGSVASNGNGGGGAGGIISGMINAIMGTGGGGASSSSNAAAAAQSAHAPVTTAAPVSSAAVSAVPMQPMTTASSKSIKMEDLKEYKDKQQQSSSSASTTNNNNNNNNAKKRRHESTCVTAPSAATAAAGAGGGGSKKIQPTTKPVSISSHGHNSQGHGHHPATTNSASASSANTSQRNSSRMSSLSYDDSTIQLTNPLSFALPTTTAVTTGAAGATAATVVTGGIREEQEEGSERKRLKKEIDHLRAQNEYLTEENLRREQAIREEVSQEMMKRSGHLFADITRLREQVAMTAQEQQHSTSSSSSGGMVVAGSASSPMAQHSHHHRHDDIVHKSVKKFKQQYLAEQAQEDVTMALQEAEEEIQRLKVEHEREIYKLRSENFYLKEELARYKPSSIIHSKPVAPPAIGSTASSSAGTGGNDSIVIMDENIAACNNKSKGMKSMVTGGGKSPIPVAADSVNGKGGPQQRSPLSAINGNSPAVLSRNASPLKQQMMAVEKQQPSIVLEVAATGAENQAAGGTGGKLTTKQIMQNYQSALPNNNQNLSPQQRLKHLAVNPSSVGAVGGGGGEVAGQSYSTRLRSQFTRM